MVTQYLLKKIAIYFLWAIECFSKRVGKYTNVKK